MKWIKHLLLLCTLALLVSVSCAYADDSDDDRKPDRQAFKIGKDLEMVSTIKFDYDKPKIIIKSVYPQLNNMNGEPIAETEMNRENTVDDIYTEYDKIAGKDGLSNFNQLVAMIVQEEINAFKNEVKNKSSNGDAKNRLYIDYDASIIRSGKSHLLSIRFSMQGSISGTYQYHYHRSLNYDLENDQKIELQDLFKPDSNYLFTLSHFARHTLLRGNASQDVVLNGTSPVPINFDIWNLKPRGILITFDSRQVASHQQGTQTIIVPYAILKKIIAPSAAITGCIKHRYDCMEETIVTGGFIDEAQNQRDARRTVPV